MKEFSNDPTKQVQELSTLFETRLAVIQENIKRLKFDLEKCSEVRYFLFKSVCSVIVDILIDEFSDSALQTHSSISLESTN
jgi:hypothetical protein